MGAAAVCAAATLVFAGGVAGGADDFFPRLGMPLPDEDATLADVFELTTFHADVRGMD